MSSEHDFSRHIEIVAGKAGNAREVVPRFFSQSVELTFKSAQEGRPCFEERVFVDIMIPGDRNSRVTEPLSDEHKRRWPAAWKAFEENREAPLEGTALADWPPISRARVDELAYFHIKTVEQLAGVDDMKLQNLGMGARELRAAAQKFLEVSRTGTAPLMRLVTDNQRLTDDLARANKTIADQEAEIERLKAILIKERI